MSTIEVQPQGNEDGNKNTKDIFIPKLMNYFFLFIHAIYSLDLGFIKYRSTKAKVVIKVYFITQSLLVCLVCLYMAYFVLTRSSLFIYSASLAEYFTYVLILTFCPVERNFHRIQTDLQRIDKEYLNSNDLSENMELKIMFYFTFSVSIKIIISAVYCSIDDHYCLKPFLAQILFFVPVGGTIVTLVSVFFIFYSVYVRLQKLRTIVHLGEVRAPRCNYIYKLLHDKIDKTISLCNVLLTAPLLFNMPMLMVYMYSCLEDYKNQYSPSVTYGLQFFIFIHSLIFIFTPVMVADWISIEARKIKIILYDMLLVNKDKQDCDDIKLFIEYIEARPFKFKICKIIPLDWTLPVTILNICVTYLIIAIQFSHLY